MSGTWDTFHIRLTISRPSYSIIKAFKLYIKEASFLFLPAYSRDDLLKGITFISDQ